MFGPKGWAVAVIKSISSLVLQNMPLGGDRQYTEKTPIDGAFASTYNALEIASKKENKNCYYKLPLMPKDFDEKWFSFEQEQQGKISISLVSYDNKNNRNIASKKEEISNADPSNLNLCAVTEGDLESLRTYLLNGQVKPAYVGANLIEIKKNGFKLGTDGKLIRLGSKGMFVDGTKNDYDLLYLYKGDNDNVCFVPVYESTKCEVDNDMITTKCFESKYMKQCT